MRVGQFHFEINLLERMTIEIKRRITNEILSIFKFNIFMAKIYFILFFVFMSYVSLKIVLWYEKKYKMGKENS